MNFDLVLGDNSGYMYMKKKQKLYLEYDDFSLLRSAPPINLVIDYEAEIWTSADFKVIGAGELAFKVRNLQVTTFVFCSSHLLMFFGSLNCKQYGPRSDCSLGAEGLYYLKK